MRSFRLAKAVSIDLRNLPFRVSRRRIVAFGENECGVTHESRCRSLDTSGSVLVRRRIQTPFGAGTGARHAEGEVVLGAPPPARLC